MAAVRTLQILYIFVLRALKKYPCTFEPKMHG